MWETYANSAALSDRAGEGRKFLREAARQAGQNGQAPISNSPCALRNTKHVHQPWRSWGEATLDPQGISFSSTGHSPLCDEVQKHQPRERLLAHLLLQLCTPVIQKFCARAALLLDTSAYMWIVSTDPATSPWWSILSLPPPTAQLNIGNIPQ